MDPAHCTFDVQSWYLCNKHDDVSYKKGTKKWFGAAKLHEIYWEIMFSSRKPQKSHQKPVRHIYVVSLIHATNSSE